MKRASRWIGLGLLLCVALTAFALDQLGRKRQPRHYTLRFSSGIQLEAGSQGLLESIAGTMAVSDALEAVIVGHTGTRGDQAINQELSQKRAEFVKQQLVERGVQPSRTQTFGVGGQDPLEKKSGEGERSYHQRLKRAEITLKR